MSTTRRIVLQAAALAIKNGRICLVTSNSGKRWVLPKGCFERGKTAEEIAAQEAWEEAGLVGDIQPMPLGEYCYRKAGREHHVTVFAMNVTDVAQDWPEADRRARRWLRPNRALTRLRERDLRAVIRGVWQEWQTME